MAVSARRGAAALALGACLLIGGCGGSARYERPGQDEARAEQDQAECLWKAEQATGNLPESGRKERITQLVDACMKAKGYAVR